MRRHLRTTYAGTWLAALESLRFVLDLTVAQVRTLVLLAQEFEKRNQWKGSGDWHPDKLARASISLEACRLVLHLGLGRYARVRTVIVHPTTWPGTTERGPAMLAGWADHESVKIAWDMAKWSATRPSDGYSIVYHEFAHVLDYQDGLLDGMPPLRDRRHHPGWLRRFQHGLDELRGRLRRRQPSVLRDYGGTDPTEFFAVCTESFFERPAALRRHHPRLYSALARFYHQDPAGRGQRRARRVWKEASSAPSSGREQPR
jgi:Mlc titration factor MtfA (ptsG expression regulator)